jgi:glycosyltransferase involved in cell wall biosynthesis
MITEYSLRRADMIACDAESVKREIVTLTDYPEEKIAVFPFGINLNRFNPDADGNAIRKRLEWEDKKIVIMTRSFRPVYGVEYFLRSIPDIIANVPEARIMLCGSGLLEDEFKDFIDREGLNTYVHFAGYVRNEELPDYLTAADVYVSSSLSDGTSLSLLEAQACGLPVVVSDVAANQEWVTDGVNGFIVPMRDSHKLSEKVIELLRDTELRKRLGLKNIRIAQERANWDRNFEKFETIYQELIDRRLERNC